MQLQKQVGFWLGALVALVLFLLTLPFRRH